MSTFTAIAIMVALALVQRFLYGFDDRWIQNRRDAIVSGVIGGRPASTQDRWTLVYTGWWGGLAGQLGFKSDFHSGGSSSARALTKRNFSSLRTSPSS